MTGDKMTAVATRDHLGNMIDGSDLLACIDGEKVLSNDFTSALPELGLAGNALLSLSCLDNRSRGASSIGYSASPFPSEVVVFAATSAQSPQQRFIAP